MSKAEDRALEAYPIVMSEYSDNCKEYDSNESERLTFIEGYHQAEKDLALTYKDVARIFVIATKLTVENTTPMTDKEFYQEVLKRFNERKH